MPQKDSLYIDHTGTMIIPFNADSKYHYWNDGQPLLETLMELNVPEDIWGKHTEKPYPGNTAWTRIRFYKRRINGQLQMWLWWASRKWGLYCWPQQETHSELVKEVGGLFVLQELVQSAKKYSYGEQDLDELLDLIRRIFPVKNPK